MLIVARAADIKSLNIERGSYLEAPFRGFQVLLISDILNKEIQKTRSRAA
jgi:hypothetical protein